VDDEAGRLGNVEIERYPVGGAGRNSGLRTTTDGAADSKTLLVEIGPPLSAEAPLLIGCRLYKRRRRYNRHSGSGAQMAAVPS
jgi:hypothetical protein